MGWAATAAVLRVHIKCLACVYNETCGICFVVLERERWRRRASGSYEIFFRKIAGYRVNYKCA